jgi:tetratricopeptide (TPR) repeat protein
LYLALLPNAFRDAERRPTLAQPSDAQLDLEKPRVQLRAGKLRQSNGYTVTNMKCETIADLENFLKIQEQALGANAPEVATTATKLGDLYKKAGQLEEAEKLYKRALSIRENSVVGFHHDEAESSRQDLEALKGPPQDRPRTVVDALKQIATAQPQKKEPPFEVTISSTNLEPVRWKSVPEINEAINDCRMEADLLKQMVGGSHPSVADILTRLADLYCRLRMYAEMEPLLVEALKIRETTCGANHHSVSTELKNLAHLYMAQNRLYLAEPLLKRAIVIREKSYGKMHPRVADVEESYASLLRKTNRIYQAEALEAHVNQIRSSQSTENMTSGRWTVFKGIW